MGGGSGRLPVSLWAFLLVGVVDSVSELDLATCRDTAACKARFDHVSDRFSEISREIGGKQVTLSTLEQLRSGVLGQRRPEVHPVQRKHLQTESPLVGQLSFDARHRPIASNATRYFNRTAVVGAEVEVRLHDFVPLRPPGSGSNDVLQDAVLVTVSGASDLSVYNLVGAELLVAFDLGHQGRIEHLTTMFASASQEPLVVTADDHGRARAHWLKVKSTSVSPEEARRREELAAAGGSVDAISSTELAAVEFVCTFKVPAGAFDEAPMLTAVEVAVWNQEVQYVVGDSQGGVSVFVGQGRGRLRGRVRITEHEGGIKGFVRTLVGPLVVYSERSFGHFSLERVDLEYPMCSGWASPIAHVAVDVTYSPTRVFVALADGDVVVVNTERKAGKACDVALKFPRVSPMPFALHPCAGYMVGVPIASKATLEVPLEVYVFDLKAMEGGYGVAPSRSVYVQALLGGGQPGTLRLWSGGKPPHVRAAVRFVGARGVELLSVRLRTARRSEVSSVEGLSEERALGGWPLHFKVCGAIASVLLLAFAGWFAWKHRRSRTCDPADDGTDESDEARESAQGARRQR